MDRALGSDVHVDGALLRRRTGVADQERFVRGLVRDLGYDFDAGALGVTVHPFCQSIAPGDVRIATRYRADNLATALFGTVHEAGHGLYEQGIHLAGLPSPVSTFASLAVHESQSRLYENHVARSHAFWRGRWTHLLEAFPGTFDDVDVDTFHMHVGRVAPSLVRVEADEVSYPLHVVMRTELEIALIGGTLDVADLPSAWNEASAKWLGIVPDDATSGHLQDIHWSMGAFGYFPTYVLGSMAAAQFWESIDDALGGADADMAAGRYDGILSWLREHVHGRGAMEWPSTLVRSATGSDLEPSAFVRHLEARVAQVYGVTSGIDPRS
jgi:carboxypeptidase Taq